jgi:30S ribosomal protein S31
MGKGDKKTKRGKITIGSYGVRRKKKSENTFVKNDSNKGAGNASDESKEVKAPKKETAKKETATKKPAAKKAPAKKQEEADNA